MKAPGSLLIGLLLWSACLAPVRGAETGRLAAGKHSAWRLQGTNCNVYLLGSVHVLKDEHYPLPAVFESAFSNARVVVFETDIGAMMKPETQMKLMERAMLPADETLKDCLSEKTYAALKQRLESSGLPEAMVMRMKPGFAMMTLVMVEVQRLGYKVEQGMDVYFYTRAREQGKTIRGLEDLNFQLGLICDLSKDEGESVVKSSLEDLADAKSRFDELLAAWQTGDEEALEKLLNEANRKEPALMKKLLTDRNAAWVPQIEKYARGTNDVAIIVGTGHLVGQDGVVDLLRKQNWKITQQ